MSTPVVLDSGLLWILGEGRTDGQTWRLRLFQNDYEPEPTSELVDFEEADFSGYTYGDLTKGPLYVADPDEVAFDLSPYVITHDGGGTSNNVYGYWVEAATAGPGGGPLPLFAERFDAPQTMASAVDTITVIATVALARVTPP